ncbi:MAG: IS66 family transposase [Gemmatimonadetes bacterium]|nr:IS66 family transposase [Gemmatimonadota bacterium]
MAVLDEDFCTDLTAAEGDDALWPLPVVVPAPEPLDWPSLLEEAEARIKEEQARARVAELRREELRRSEADARAIANTLTRQLDVFRFKLKTAKVKTASALERRIKAQDTEIADLQLTLRRSHERRERIETDHRNEINWLKQDMDRERSRVVKVYREGKRVAESLRNQFDRQIAAARRRVAARESTIEWLRERNDRMRAAIVRATALIASLREKNAGLRAEVRDLKDENVALASQVETLQAQLDKLRSTRSVLSKALYGSRSERQKKPGTGRKRGQQRGAAGHGRTQRPGLGKKKETREPPEEARVCPRCGRPYASNGERCTTLFEIDVEAYENTIVRPRYRRTCDCASAPREVTAPAVTRLFETTPYGISVWACMLYERFACLRPLCRVAAWMADMGLAISPGTLADSIKRFVPLFEPLYEAILAHQNEAALRHADETTWRVQAYREKGRSSRAWLWISVSPDAVYFHIDPSRSAEVAMKLFGSVKDTVVLVCDRFSSYKSLARELAGKVILQWCWAHQRRSFIDRAAGHVRLRRWCERWIQRIALIYRLNDDRLEHYDPAHPLERQSPAFDAAHARLKEAVDELFAAAEAELASMTDRARKAKPLRSLLKHREGLCVFVDRPFVPMDNNRGELELRFAVIGRRLSFGSDSVTGAGFTATMYSVAGTLKMNGIDVRRWLREWLTACAENGGKPPDDLSPWLPWSMGEERRRELAASG